MTAILATSEEVAKWVDSHTYGQSHGLYQAQQLHEHEELRHLQAEEASTSTVNNPQSYLPGPAASKPADHSNFSFICECFFLTARVLNLGLIKALLDFKTLVQVSTFEIYLLSTNLGLLALLMAFLSLHLLTYITVVD